jgi:hypothetical protein
VPARPLSLLLLGVVAGCVDRGGAKAAGDPAGTAEAVDGDGDGWLADEDCDDTDPGVYPGAAETCDGRDEDCDGQVDEDAVDAELLYADADGDGFGDADQDAVQCAGPGLVADATDCNDRDPGVFPGAVERCDGVDEDCDRRLDNDAVDPSPWYADSDGDGFGDPEAEVLACTAPEGHVADNTDCDDSSELALPGGTEVCDALDNDCDGTVDADRVPSDFPTIAAALDALPDGATLCLDPGVHREAVDLGSRSVELVGAGGPGGTVLDPSGLGVPAFTVAEGGALSLRELGVRSLVDDDGSAQLVAASGGSVVLETVVIEGNSWRLRDDAEAVPLPLIAVEGARLAVQGLEVRGNSWALEPRGGSVSVAPGAVIQGAEGSELALVDVVFEGNQLQSAGPVAGLELSGVLLDTTAATVALERLTVADTAVTVEVVGDALVEGAVVRVDGGTLAVTDLRVEHSGLGLLGQAGDLEVAGQVWISGAVGSLNELDFVDNTLDTEGGNAVQACGPLVLAGEGSALDVDGLRLHGNMLALAGALGNTWGRGGGACVWGDASLRHVDARANVVVADRAAGGGLWLGSTDGVHALTNATFAANHVGGSQTDEASGGGLAVYGYRSSVTLDHLTLFGNTAEAVEATGVGLHLALDVDSVLRLTHSTATDSAAVATTVTGLDLALDADGPASVDWQHNNLGQLAGRAADETDLSVEPQLRDTTDPDPLRWDLRLDGGSPLVDAGAEDCRDGDGSRCDVGGYGGAYGSW